MSRKAKQSSVEQVRAEERQTAEAGPVAALLASLWLIVAGIQYLGAHQRMLVITGKEPWLEAIALLDMTPLYVVLVLATILYALLRHFRSGGGT